MNQDQSQSLFDRLFFMLLRLFLSSLRLAFSAFSNPLTRSFCSSDGSVSIGSDAAVWTRRRNYGGWLDSASL